MLVDTDLIIIINKLLANPGLNNNAVINTGGINIMSHFKFDIKEVFLSKILSDNIININMETAIGYISVYMDEIIARIKDKNIIDLISLFFIKLSI